MILMALLFLVQWEDLTPEQRDEIRARIERTVRNSSSKEQTLADFLPDSPDYAPMKNSGDGSFMAGIIGKSWGGGSAEQAGAFQVELIPFQPQKQCLCAPGCPNCAGECSECSCIFLVPSKTRWQWKMKRNGVRKGGLR